MTLWNLRDLALKQKWVINLIKGSNLFFTLIVILRIYSNSNMQNSMMLFTFAVLDQKYPFWENWSKK